MRDRLLQRARLYAALGDPARLAMVDELATSDRSPAELAARFGMASNLVAHHLSVLEQVGLVERVTSTGDRRRRYVRLVGAPQSALGLPVSVPEGLALFVCTHNSARSQLAAALWEARTGRPATSAGTHPTKVHPLAVAAAERAGLDLAGAEPQHLDDAPAAALVVTVCDQAHEALTPEPDWWHWSTPDPTEVGSAPAFDATIAQLDARIRALNRRPGGPVVDDQTVGEPTPEQILLIEQAAERLEREFEGTFDAETIERYLTESRAMLETKGRSATRPPVLIEQLTRDRLRALARLEVGTLDRPAVLFACVHNTGRSQMAAGYLRHLAGGRVDVFSGGSDPGSEQNQAAIAAMAEIGVDIASEHPKPWTDEIARAADVVVTMGCGDACPVVPGQRYEDWELDDPAGQPIEAVRAVRDEIRTRVEQLLASLDPARA